MIHFEHPWYLTVFAAYIVFLLAYLRVCRNAGVFSLPSVRRRTLVFVGMHVFAASLLFLAAAGPEWLAFSRNMQIVVAADVSDSVFYLPRQTTLMSELLSGVGRDCDVGVVVFGRTAAPERPLLPLPPDAFELHSNRHLNKNREQRAELPPLPALDREQRRTLVDSADTSATDIGEAIGYIRNYFPPSSKTKAILMISDFRDTEGHALAAAATLSGSGIDLLAAPAILGSAAQAHIASIHVPESAQVGRSVPIEVTVAALAPCTVRVELWVRIPGQRATRLQPKTVEITRDSGTPEAELTRTVRFLDTPDAQGVAYYCTRIAAEREPLPGAGDTKDTLMAAVPVKGPSQWAVLTRPGSNSTLKSLATARKLGVECRAFETGHFPTRGADYKTFSGILVDGLSAAELPEAAIGALADAVAAGKGLVAIGGERAFGAGEHQPDGHWEQLLPVKMTPEDDRTRSIVFIIDISSSMDDPMNGGNGRKLDFASQQMTQAALRLNPRDRVGLITFSDTAQSAVELEAEPTRAKFRDVLARLKTTASTDLLAPIQKAREVLSKDDAEEQLIVLLSDGDMTTSTPPEDVTAAVRSLCPEPTAAGVPRRTSIFTFGIGTDPRDNARGDKLMKDIAEAGGGVYSNEFNRLAERLEKAFESQNSGFFKRREPYALRASGVHPLLERLGGAWPATMQFRNRVKPKPEAETLLFSAPVRDANQKGARRPDPLLVLSGAAWPGAGRCAAAAFSWDGEDGELLLGSPAGANLLRTLLEWAETTNDEMPAGLSLNAAPLRNGDLNIELRASDAAARPVNGLAPHALLTEIDPAEEKPALKQILLPAAPGVYRATIKQPAAGRVYKLVVIEGSRILPPRFVTMPFSAETTQLGVDRSAMNELVFKAGGGSRTIERPQHIKEWADAQSARAMSQAMQSLLPWLAGAGLLALLGLYVVRQS